MRVKIGKYVDWIGPYQIAEKLLFWIPKYKKDSFDHNEAYDKYVHGLGMWLSEDRNGNDSWLTKACQWVHDKKKRTVKVHIDNYDVWSMDHTLALVILPMLRKLHEQKHGGPHVDDEDVPWDLRSTIFTKENEWDTDPNHFKRWDWVMDEMIWTFEQLVDEDGWESRYHHGNVDIQWKQCEDNPEYSEMTKGPKDTHWFDKDGYMNHSKKIDNGLRLFGKYYRALWD